MTEVIYPEERLRQKIHIRDPTLRNALSEFIGTALLLFIGIGIVMQFVLSGEKLNTWIQINIGWGLAIAFCVYACSKTSECFSPLTVKEKLRLFSDQFIKYAGNQRTIIGPKATAICFCSFPALHVSNTTAFFDQVAGTALLMFFVCVIIDKRIAIPGWVHPFLFGFVVIMIGTSVGMNVGYPINPARDLGPRIFMLFIGYGSQAFT
ncbi:transporter, major intrinsic protein family protein [Ancylostoma caninum]|uniref:Transporter, major intrinsic protein family protein n=1 Tax=Ancylostoma caninum TaxID=29170 RepID=A0A368F642_ANCCA|nr:transporter, major intrinsic protein family protein [Ancylostoma caninum]